MKKLTESIKDVVTFLDDENTNLEYIKDDLLNMGFICISSKIYESIRPDRYDIDTVFKKRRATKKWDNRRINYQGQLYRERPNWWEYGETVVERDKRLEKDLKDSGFFFFKTSGRFEGEDEFSFMVMPLKPSIDEGEDNSGFDYENFDDLKDFGQTLTNMYSQYSVLIQEPQFEGGAAYYMDGNGKPVDAMDEIDFDTITVLNAYASTLADRRKDKKGGFTYKNFYGKDDAKEDLDVESKRKSVLKRAKHVPSYDFNKEDIEFFESVYREAQRL